MYFGNRAGWRSEAASTSRVNHGIIVLGMLWSEVNSGTDRSRASFAGVIVAFAQGNGTGAPEHCSVRAAFYKCAGWDLALPGEGERGMNTAQLAVCVLAALGAWSQLDSADARSTPVLRHKRPVKARRKRRLRLVRALAHCRTVLPNSAKHTATGR
jgi:hypothetical protein